MTPAQVFNGLYAQEKAKLLEEACDAVSREEIEREFALWAKTDQTPTFNDLHYDVQEAILPALRRLI
jgi:hypothetical protein